jgi:hypothetical protein
MARRKRSQRKRSKSRQSTRNRQTLNRQSNKKTLTDALKWFLPDDSIFAELNFHGNTSWVPRCLVWMAICWAWSECRNVTDAFAEALEVCVTMSGSSALSTYQGFMGALANWTPRFVDPLCVRLHDRMEQIAGKFWRVGKWVPIAFDGSRETAPRTQSNEQAYCAPNYGKGKKAKYGKYARKNKKNARPPRAAQAPEPQVWLTMLWHMALRLPWLWRLGPSNSSERAHVIDMVTTGTFPKNTLFCGDAGFVGYPLWSAILDNDAHFLIRVGANVKLLADTTNYRLLENGLVLCWPEDIRLAGQPPLHLRLVNIGVGNKTLWLLTSVLDQAQLTPKQMLKLYKMRWGVEVEFRGLKQTMDRAKLRCRNDKRLLAELHWSIMAMALTELFALKEQLSTRGSQQLGPSRRSLANALRAIRYCMRHLNEIPPPEKRLLILLQLAVTDGYQRRVPKTARNPPPNPDKKPLGNPVLRELNTDEKKALQLLKERTAA